ncbi:type II toxin-antitoxin system HicB family antitoxin [Candidatus Electrothrix sp.]|uniref:type II toxin-antitoxin system HicB family antitoxin n=1 Tax=Candidatus Electrothrix sp. TaxID=2170559 RepID=UPI004056B245
MMTYKGYSAKVNFDARDNIFWGKVIGIKDNISFEGETVSQLTQDFHNAVEHYLADCKQEGRSPDKPYSGKLTLRIAPSVHAQLSAAAAHTGKSLNKWVADTLEQAVLSS